MSKSTQNITAKLELFFPHISVKPSVFTSTVKPAHIWIVMSYKWFVIKSCHLYNENYKCHVVTMITNIYIITQKKPFIPIMSSHKWDYSGDTASKNKCK